MKLLIKEGQRFGKLTIVKEVDRLRQPSGQTQRAFLCKCECGKEKVIRMMHFTRGRISSCGCIRSIWDGLSTERIFKTWNSMKERVHSSKFVHFTRYKERGISICKEWDNNFLAFRNWALVNGYKDNLQIDRIDNNGNYEPSNCRFVTNMENANNREQTFYVNYNCNTYPIMQLFRQLNTPQQNQATIRARIKRGWDHTKAFNKPIRNGNYKTKSKQNINNTEINPKGAEGV